MDFTDGYKVEIYNENTKFKSSKETIDEINKKIEETGYFSYAEQIEQVYELLGVPAPLNVKWAADEERNKRNPIYVVRCKDCIHRPYINGEYENGFSIEFPSNVCPCQCDDGWYNWMPADDWYCANGERRFQNEPD